MTTTDTPLDHIHAGAFEHGFAGSTLAAALGWIAEDAGLVLTEADFDAAIYGHADGAREALRRARPKHAGVI